MDYRVGREPDGSRDAVSKAEGIGAAKIKAGWLVILYSGREAIGFVRPIPGGIYQCRFGAFYHDDMIDKPFGSKVFSRKNKGWVWMLSPTPELWSAVVPNRTQIVQDFDQSIVIFRLGMKPGDIVVESGTGSGIMSTAVMRTIAPSGHLHTFEFNKTRADLAREEFKDNMLDKLVTVAHGDVCAARESGGGFGAHLDRKVDAVFLDLPEPWLALSHSRLALKPGKKLCSYSPCIEQVMKTCEVLRQEGYTNISTIEFRLRTFAPAEVELEQLDFGAKTVSTVPACANLDSNSENAPCVVLAGKVGGCSTKEVHSLNMGTSGEQQDSLAVDASSCEASCPNDQTKNSCNGSVGSSHSEGVSKKRPRQLDAERNDSTAVLDTCAVSGAAVTSRDNVAEEKADRLSLDSSSTTSVAKDRLLGGGKAEGGATDGESTVSQNDCGLVKGSTVAGVGCVGKLEYASAQTRARSAIPVVCAQPNPAMRGHTAFLTFGTTPLIYRPASVVAGTGNTIEGMEVDVAGGDGRISTSEEGEREGGDRHIGRGTPSGGPPEASTSE
ncbi:unnamed protein product [Choristocarpus tenellus]